MTQTKAMSCTRKKEGGIGAWDRIDRAYKSGMSANPKREFTKIKNEANLQYDKVKTGLELIKKTLGETKARDRRGESIYG